MEDKVSDILQSLNPVQREAASHTEGPLLILAGAGSGKTRVLTHRIAYLIEEKQVNPWNIMAITFTNKAAQEMRERVDSLVKFGSESIWVATFHSSCVKILRRYIDRLGYDNNFTIYDTDDQKTLIRKAVKELELDPKQYKEGALLAVISSAKNEMIDYSTFGDLAGGNFRKCQEAKVYALYQKALMDNNALDFDDILMLTVHLFKECPEILESYQERLRYIMVDEYQDTNAVQFELIRLLSAKYKNLCVVGDDDQSIYKFRGADITNILSFEKTFPGARVVTLEQNYRSTNNILEVANSVIANNEHRRQKRLWSENGQGEKVRFNRYDSAYDEAESVIDEIKTAVLTKKYSYKDHVVLYRTNAQSRAFEEKCVAKSVPYRLVGGVNFYQRQEIKDILAYLKTIESGRDDLSVTRIINVPKRGIGQVTLTKLSVYASERGIGLLQAMENSNTIPGLGKAADKIKAFVNQIMVFRALAREEKGNISELIDRIIETTGYFEELEKLEEDKAAQKKENIEELKNKAAEYSITHTDGSLTDFLEEVSLVAEVDNMDKTQDMLTLMTIHSAKGLEFPVVYMTGMEDGLFPSYRSIASEDYGEIEEERRLCYVGITRAQEELFMTCARQRMVRGEIHYNRVSRFVTDIPAELLAQEEKKTESAPKTEAERQKRQPTAYQQARETFKTKVFDPKQFQVKKADGLDYGVGDRVKHIKFGTGTVNEIVEGGRDYEVTVAFDRVGVKKMFASFAKLVKTE